MYFTQDDPFAFCTTFTDKEMIKECIWEFAIRLNVHTSDYARLFANLSDYLSAHDYLDEYAEWAARGLGHHFSGTYVHAGEDDAVVKICRSNPNSAIQRGCLRGVIEGYVSRTLWGHEMSRMQSFCSNELLTADEQMWCLDLAEKSIRTINQK